MVTPNNNNNITTRIVWLLFAVLIISTTSLITLLIVTVFPRYHRGRPKEGAPPSGGSCSASGGSCGALDPVNDPDYNMRNVVKQSILLEEHLAEANKYCEPCIVKHFLHIIGLVEEAVWLAGTRLSTFPHLADSADFYNMQFERWRAARRDDDTVREVLGALRERRRGLVESYFLSD